MITESQKKGLEQLVKSAELKGKKVLVRCVDNRSGKTALSFLKAAFPEASTQLITSYGEWWLFWGAGFKYEDFYLKFDTKGSASACVDEINEVISEAIANGTYGAGDPKPSLLERLGQLIYGSSGSNSFFKSNTFYVLCAIAVIIILATVGIKIIQNKKH